MAILRSSPAERTPDELLDFGVCSLDKPPGPSSHQVAAWVRDLTRREHAAHGGTLDPDVTGCLPLLVGDATRLARVFLEAPKAYVAVLEAHAPLPTDFGEVCATFEGEIHQRPPKRSAVARERRIRRVHAIDVQERTERRALLRVRCESGTYVRKLCHDIGLASGAGAHMGDLRRVAAGPFDDRELATLHDLADGLAFWRENDDPSLLREVVRPAEAALRHLPAVTIAPSAAREVAEGAPVYAPGVITGPEDATPLPPDAAGEPPLVVCLTPDDTAICLGRLVGDPDADRGTVVELERVLV